MLDSSKLPYHPRQGERVEWDMNGKTHYGLYVEWLPYPEVLRCDHRVVSEEYGLLTFEDNGALRPAKVTEQPEEDFKPAFMRWAARLPEDEPVPISVAFKAGWEERARRTQQSKDAVLEDGPPAAVRLRTTIYNALTREFRGSINIEDTTRIANVIAERIEHHGLLRHGTST